MTMIWAGSPPPRQPTGEPGHRQTRSSSPRGLQRMLAAFRSGGTYFGAAAGPWPEPDRTRPAPLSRPAVGDLIELY